MAGKSPQNPDQRQGLIVHELNIRLIERTIRNQTNTLRPGRQAAYVLPGSGDGEKANFHFGIEISFSSLSAHPAADATSYDWFTDDWA